MTKRKNYYATLDRNGTEDEITIHAPDGCRLAFIWFWDEPDTGDAAKAGADAKLIVDALNSYRPAKKRRAYP